MAADTVSPTEIAVAPDIDVCAVMESGLFTVTVSATVNVLEVPPEMINPSEAAFKVRLLKVVADIFLAPVMLPVIVASPPTLSAFK